MMFGFGKNVPTDEYLDIYLGAEHDLRQRYGELAYYSKPVIYEKDGKPLPVAPWAEFAGDPLILPDPRHVKIIAITLLVDSGGVVTLLRHLDDVVKVLKSTQKLTKAKNPSHLCIEFKNDDRSSLYPMIEQLAPYPSS